MDKELWQLVRDLVKIETKYNTLIEYLLNNARLNYSETSLSIDGCEDIVKALEPKKFDEKYDLLSIKKSMMNDDDK